MKTASELRKALDEALKPDSSGKTTPIQRLTPFLRALMDYLEEREQIEIVFDAEEGKHRLKVSSTPATQAAPALPTSESGSASKATA